MLSQGYFLHPAGSRRWQCPPLSGCKLGRRETQGCGQPVPATESQHDRHNTSHRPAASTALGFLLLWSEMAHKYPQSPPGLPSPHDTLPEEKEEEHKAPHSRKPGKNDRSPFSVSHHPPLCSSAAALTFLKVVLHPGEQWDSEPLHPRHDGSIRGEE